MTTRDTIALEVLKISLHHRTGSLMSNIARDCYAMADAMEAARGTQPHQDTTRLDWVLAAFSDDSKWLAFNRCLSLGMTSRDAIDAATKTHPL